MKNLKQIAAFVREHGFKCDMSPHAVSIHMPYVTDDGESGIDYLPARTLDEAKALIGY